MVDSVQKYETTIEDCRQVGNIPTYSCFCSGRVKEFGILCGGDSSYVSDIMILHRTLQMYGINIKIQFDASSDLHVR